MIREKKYILLWLIMLLCLGIGTWLYRMESKEIEQTWRAGEQIALGENYKIEGAEEKDQYLCTVSNDAGDTIYTEKVTAYVAPTAKQMNGAVIIHYGAGTGVYFDKVVSIDGKKQTKWMYNARLIGEKYVLYLNFGHDDSAKTFLKLEELYNDNSAKCFPFPNLADEWDVDTYKFINHESEVFIRYTNKVTNEMEEKTIKLSEFR